MTWDAYKADIKKSGCCMDLVGVLAEAASRRLEVTGKLWVAQVIFDGLSYATAVEKEQQKLERLLPQLRARNPEIQTVMLLSCRAERLTGGAFGLQGLAAQILTASDGWKDVMARQFRVNRGYARSPKMDLVGESQGHGCEGCKSRLVQPFPSCIEAAKGQCRQACCELQ